MGERKKCKGNVVKLVQDKQLILSLKIKYFFKYGTARNCSPSLPLGGMKDFEVQVIKQPEDASHIGRTKNCRWVVVREK